MTLGIYGDPLWIHVGKNDTTTKIAGTNINVSSLIDTSEVASFTWVQVDRPGAEEYIKGCIKYYADMVSNISDAISFPGTKPDTTAMLGGLVRQGQGRSMKKL